MSQPVCAVVGAGPGNGASLARRFSAAGHRVALCSRNLERLEELSAGIPNSKPYVYDAAQPDTPGDVFARIRKDLGPVTTLVYNAGSAVFGDIDALAFDDFRKAWEINTGGLFQATKSVLPDMRAAGGGDIVVIGATASRKGSAGFSAFASAKAGQRMLAESLARKLGPEQIHVCYVIIDGVIDIPRTRAMLRDRPDDFFLNADKIADAVWFVTQQDPSAWTFELDLRPFGEKW
ncbi:MAG: SDR family NAD(P)-dependent oxidoreductase [Myxococcota bacterium]|nr:SDR family NAD(P)-dependent oxidoreductase [Myxococcota bacterium]